jgi:hypothetical protein
MKRRTFLSGSAMATLGGSLGTREREEFPVAQSGTTGRATPAQLSSYFGLTGGSGLGFFNIMDYGAVGDGSTNDTNAIIAAIDAAGAAGGGVVYVPPGTYSTSSLKPPHRKMR